MVHEGQRLPLRIKSGDDLLGIHPQLDDLQGHAAADRSLLVGHIHDAAATLADLLEEFVMANHVAGLLGGSDVEANSAGRFPARVWLVQESSGLFVRPQERFDALAQPRVLAARAFYIGGALLGRPLPGGLKDSLFALSRLVHSTGVLSLSLPHTAKFREAMHHGFSQLEWAGGRTVVAAPLGIGARGIGLRPSVLGKVKSLGDFCGASNFGSSPLNYGAGMFSTPQNRA